jgi:hypothetical protein
MQTFLDNTKCLLKSVEKGCIHSNTITEFPEHHKENQVAADFQHVFYEDTLHESQKDSPFKADKSIEKVESIQRFKTMRSIHKLNELTCQGMIQSMKDKLTAKAAIVKENVVEYQFRPELNKLFGKGGMMQQTDPNYS